MRTPLLAAAAAMLLAACAPTTQTGAISYTSTKPTSVTEQGFKPLKLGQEAGLGCPSSNPTTCAVRFAVTAIDVAPACDPHRKPPPAGQKTVVLHVTMTTKQPEKADAARAGLLFSTVQLKAIGPGGEATPVDYGFCLDQPGTLSRDIGPNATYEGFMDLAVDQAATSIATSKAQSDEPGWVWPLD